MKEFFDAVISMEQVYGAVILDEEGRVVYDPLRLNKIEARNAEEDWSRLIFSDNFSRELDLIFEKGRLYIRKIKSAYLLVFMDSNCSVASLKLTCDLYEQESGEKKPRKKNFFSFFS